MALHDTVRVPILADPASDKSDTDCHQHQSTEQVVVINSEQVQLLGREEAGGNHHGLGSVVGEDKCFGQTSQEDLFTVLDYHEPTGLERGKHHGVEEGSGMNL